MASEEQRRKWRERQRAVAARRKDAGLCLRCGRQPERKDRACCNDCLAAVAAHTDAVARRRIARGMCAGCGREPLVTRWHCRSCADVQVVRSRQRRRGVSSRGRRG